MKLEKGTYGYLKKKKCFQLLYTIIIIIISIGIFGIGCLIFHTSKNLLTIVAVLGVLPGAKALIGFITVAPFSPMPNEAYEKLHIYEKDNSKCFYEIVCTSTESVMHIDYLCVTGTECIGYTSKPSKKDEKLVHYIEESLKKRGYTVHVHIFTRIEDAEKRLSSISFDEEPNEELLSFIRTILV